MYIHTEVYTCIYRGFHNHTFTTDVVRMYVHFHKNIKFKNLIEFTFKYAWHSDINLHIFLYLNFPHFETFMVCQHMHTHTHLG